MNKNNVYDTLACGLNLYPHERPMTQIYVTSNHGWNDYLRRWMERTCVEKVRSCSKEIEQVG